MSPNAVHPAEDRCRAAIRNFVRLHFIAFLNGDAEDMKRKAALARDKPFTEDMISHVEALALARSGRLQDARQASAIAVHIA